MRRRSILIAAAGVAAVAAARTLLHPATRERARGKAIQLRGRGRGSLYRLSGRRPDPNVADDIVADRIRSALGPLEKQLDTPRIHVTVEHHVAVLHGNVPTVADAIEIETAVAQVSGVRGIRSNLHIGLGAGDTRPSQGSQGSPDGDSPR